MTYRTTKFGVVIDALQERISSVSAMLPSKWTEPRLLQIYDITFCSTVGRTLVSAGELSLSCARLLAGRVTTNLGGYAIRYRSANMASSAFHPSGVG